MDRFGHLGYFTAASFLGFLSIIPSVLPVNFTFVQSQTAADTDTTKEYYGRDFFNTIQWKRHDNTVLGFSIDYPNTLDVYIKDNRFEEGPDVQIMLNNSDYASFVDTIRIVTNLDEAATTTQTDKNITVLTSGFKEALINSFNTEFEEDMIEDTNFTRYKIDGEDAGTFITVTESYNNMNNESPRKANEYVVTTHNNQVYVFVFQISGGYFDTPLVTEIRKHIFNSIKWI